MSRSRGVNPRDSAMASSMAGALRSSRPAPSPSEEPEERSSVASVRGHSAEPPLDTVSTSMAMTSTNSIAGAMKDA